MEYLVNAQEMKTIDQNTSEIFKVPSLVLMERAACETVRVIEEQQLDSSRTLIVCGTGNNGGDGMAVGRMLFLKGAQVTIVLLGDRKRATPSLETQLAILQAYGVTIHTQIPEYIEPTLVIDALFGVGLSRNIEGEREAVINRMNTLSGTKLAIDIPSGVHATNGSLMGTCFLADLTVTFAYAKTGMYLWPGAEACGRIYVREIGIGIESWLEQKPSVAVCTKEDMSRLPKRKSHSNKGTYGKVLVIAGSVHMAGAACLAAKAAYTTGCGLVTVYTPTENRVVLQTVVPEAIVKTYTQQQTEWTELLQIMQGVNAIVCGPGIGQSETARSLLACVIKNATVPVVVDADALNLISMDIDILTKANSELILTPHLGEMSRLCGKSIAKIQGELLETAVEFAKTYQVICVLKDAHTVTAFPDGQLFLNCSGNAGMATAGSGDVLAGILAALVAQGMCVGEAAYLGVYLHGAAGDAICQETGQYGMMAQDIISGIKQILKNF